MNQRVVLVTGASSGSGLATAFAFHSRGFRVFGTSRNPEPHPLVRMLPLDVRDDGSARSVVESVMSEAERIDVLVNNAGVMLFGPVEEVPLPRAHDLFETNFWGVARMVNAVLPIFRAARHGRIINVGSVAGGTAIPMNGFYSATKHALAGYTEALRHEVAGFGIEVSLVEPGEFRSSLWEGDPFVAPTTGAYSRVRESVGAALRSLLSEAPSPEPVANAIVEIALSRVPKLHNPVGPWARALPRMKAWMPELMFERGLRRRFLGA